MPLMFQVLSVANVKTWETYGLAERTGRQPAARQFESVALNVQAQTVCRRRRSCGRTWGWRQNVW